MSNKATAEDGTPIEEENNKAAEKPGNDRYRGFIKRQQRDEQELEELEKARNKQNDSISGSQDQDDPEGDEGDRESDDLSAQEKTWKKRYGDLRRKQQKDKEATDKKIREQAEQIAKLTRQAQEGSDLPGSEEELQKWMEDRPDAAATIDRLVQKRVRAALEDTNKRFDSLEEREQENQIERARVKLMKKHPDLEELEENPEFHAWLDSKPQKMQTAIYDDPTDWEYAAEVISMYKLSTADKEKKKKKTRNTADNGAADDVSVSSRSNEPGDNQKKVWKESEVAKMTDKQFEKHEDAIREAMQEGRFKYDLQRR